MPRPVRKYFGLGNIEERDLIIRRKGKSIEYFLNRIFRWSRHPDQPSGTVDLEEQMRTKLVCHRFPPAFILGGKRHQKQVESALVHRNASPLYYDVGEPRSYDGYVPMSTAIARIYTSEGFVIAADGREWNPANQEQVSNSARKIFSVEQPRRQLAYAIAGAIRIPQIGTGETLFDFVSETARAIDKLTGSVNPDLLSFSKALKDELAPLVRQAKAKRLCTPEA